MRRILFEMNCRAFRHRATTAPDEFDSSGWPFFPNPHVHLPSVVSRNRRLDFGFFGKKASTSIGLLPWNVTTSRCNILHSTLAIGSVTPAKATRDTVVLEVLANPHVNSLSYRLRGLVSTMYNILPDGFATVVLSRDGLESVY